VRVFGVCVSAELIQKIALKVGQSAKVCGATNGEDARVRVYVSQNKVPFQPCRLAGIKEGERLKKELQTATVAPGEDEVQRKLDAALARINLDYQLRQEMKRKKIKNAGKKKKKKADRRPQPAPAAPEASEEKVLELPDDPEEYRLSVLPGMQVALLVDGKQEGVRLQIGDVCDDQDVGEGEVQIAWISGATNRSRVTGKWTPDFEVGERGQLVPEVEPRQRDNIIPVPVEWKSFERGSGGYLKPRCIKRIQAWIDIYEAEERKQLQELAVDSDEESEEVSTQRNRPHKVTRTVSI
jgi:hypothetical protein